MWQGYSLEGSIFQMGILSKGLYLQVHESMLYLTFFFLVLERWVSRDYSISRSYFWAPLLFLLTVLTVSYIRGQFAVQSFRFVFELHEAFLIPLSFFVFVNVFRDVTERKVFLWLFFFAVVMKSADATWIRAFPVAGDTAWGALLMWRDGYILATGIAGALVFAHYHGIEFRRLRIFVLLSAPFFMYALLISYRRTFIVALLGVAIMMCVTIGKGRRKKQVIYFMTMLVLLLVFVLIVDPLGIIARFAGVIMPGSEPSAFIRLMEYPNVLRNIYENPLLGTPVGVPWKEYYRIPVVANRTTIGTHNTYFYFALRGGIFGITAYGWLLARIYKSLIINIRLQRDEEDFLFNQFLLYAWVLYNIGGITGVMYSDAMPLLSALMLVLLQLQTKKMTGLNNLKNVDLLKTFKRREIVFRPPIRLTTEAAQLAKRIRAKHS